MAEQSKIEWCDHTFNPWEGCQKVGPGCDHCYAETRNARYGGGIAVNWGPGAPRRRTSVANWKKPLQWNAAHAAFFAEHGRKQRVFCASLADVFDNAVDPAWRMDLFSLIANTPNLDWLILTKRIGNVMPMCSSDGLMFDMICNRVWLGATVVNREEADRDIPKLLAVPAARRFLSMEPLLGEVDLTPHLWGRATQCADCPKDADCGCGWYPRGAIEGESVIDWVIVGGESGYNARPMHPDWARSLRDQCAAAGVPFLFKQWGEWVSADCIDYKTTHSIWRGRTHFEMLDAELIRNWKPGKPPGPPHFACNHWLKAGKKAAGRLLDGRTHDEFPVVPT